MRILKDEKILRLLKKEPSAGMDLLIETYGSLVGYIVRHKLSSVGSEEDVEECVADVFVDFYKQLDKVDQNTSDSKESAGDTRNGSKEKDSRDAAKDGAANKIPEVQANKWYL